MSNRIDISKNTPKERVIPVLMHEFAHYIHSKIENNVVKNGGTLEKIFDTKDEKLLMVIKKELLEVTNFVDENSKCEKLKYHRDCVKKKIKLYDEVIKQNYPKFQRSKRFKEFEKYIKNSKAKYLLKYDRIKLVSRWLKHVEIFSLENLEKDFPTMPKAFSTYIRLRSAQKKQSRITSRINNYKKYYQRPTELFARLVEGLSVNFVEIEEMAPNTTKRFSELLEEGYYKDLKNVLEMLSENEKISKFDFV